MLKPTTIRPYDLTPGDRIVNMRPGPTGIVRVLRAGEKHTDLFGRTQRQWWATDENTGREGFIIFGPAARQITILPRLPRMNPAVLSTSY